MYKLLFFLIGIFFAVTASAQNNDIKSKNSPKVYDQKEFDEKVEKEVLIQINRFRPKSIIGLSKELMLKGKKLKLIELNLSEREEQLKINEADLQKKIIEFRDQQQKLIACIDKNDQEKQKRVDHMVDVISGMRPVTAAEVLSVQDTEISVKILGRLPSEKVSKIFNSMEKEISARLQKQYMNMKK